MDQQPPNEPRPGRDLPSPEPVSDLVSGSQQPPEARRRSEPLIPDVLEPGDTDDGSGSGGGAPFGGGPGGMFEPRSLAGGRVQVFGCSPGCLILSLVISVILSVVLTLALNLIF